MMWYISLSFDTGPRAVTKIIFILWVIIKKDKNSLSGVVKAESMDWKARALNQNLPIPSKCIK